jgi:hypothetical protein
MPDGENRLKKLLKEQAATAREEWDARYNEFLTGSATLDFIQGRPGGRRELRTGENGDALR